MSPQAQTKLKPAVAPIGDGKGTEALVAVLVAATLEHPLWDLVNGPNDIPNGPFCRVLWLVKAG